MAADDVGSSTAEQCRHDGSKWRIWSVIEELETHGLPSSSITHPCNEKYTNDGSRESSVIQEVVPILRDWGETWAGQTGWHTLLNKKSLLHEVEESVVALQLLLDWMERKRSSQDAPVILLDVCCGKGILSMLASYLFRGKTSSHVSNIIMLDKQQDINWNHIVASNENASEEGRPSIKTWGGCNLNEIDQVLERLEAIDDKAGNSIEPFALVGIHLCKQLSPSCVGVANALGPERAPFLCLAPCCLPRIARNMPKSKGKQGGKGQSDSLPVRKYESKTEREARKEANRRRDGANKRTFADVPCYLCAEIHPIHKCNLLPADENERIDIFQKAAASNPCWKCGEIGHFRKDCPSIQLASKPRVALPPAIDLDVASLLQTKHKNHTSKGTFESYCDLLATAVQRDDMQVVDSGLVNHSVQHNNAANRDNWNRDRKSIFIVASAS
ncbi:hypothetical protein ACHAWF_006384 [Thalassiosira exigua]